MKKLSLLITATLGLALAANAQSTAKNIDLEVKSIQPVTGQTYNNYNSGDTFRVYFEVKNLGTDAIAADDSLKLVVNTKWFTSQSLNLTISAPAGFTLPANGIDTLSFPIVQGVSLGTYQGNPIIARIPTNTTVTDTHKVFVFARNVDGEYYVENGVASDGSFSGNNQNFNTNFTFGTPGTNSIKNLAQTTLNVYPNPASSSINFTHDFAKATTASVKVLDLMGRVVMTEQYDVNAGAKNFNLDVTGLANGSYFVELTTAEERGVTKFTVAK